MCSRHRWQASSPQVIRVVPDVMQSNCGSELARESGVSVGKGVEGEAVFASKLAPTGFCVWQNIM
jgi:hypothetical protein